MNFIKGIYIIFLSAILFHSCREPYMPDIEKYENILVVDALITNEAGPHMVKLSRSFAFDESYPRAEAGAYVSVWDERDESYEFKEAAPGTYLSEAGFQGQVGNSYLLRIITSDGEIYESEQVRLNRVPEIDSVSYRWEEKANAGTNQTSGGVQVYIHTHDDLNQTRYYRWEWLETWEFLTPLKSIDFPMEDRCWKSSRSSLISIGTSEHLQEDLISNQPLYFVSTKSNRLKIKYSTEILQYSLSQEAYSYWKRLEDITQNTGSLFDPTPASVNGNIYHATDPNIPVLGIFQASAVTRKRIFVDRDELPLRIHIPSGYEFCEVYDTTEEGEALEYEEE